MGTTVEKRDCRKVGCRIANPRLDLNPAPGSAKRFKLRVADLRFRAGEDPFWRHRFTVYWHRFGLAEAFLFDGER